MPTQLELDLEHTYDEALKLLADKIKEYASEKDMEATAIAYNIHEEHKNRMDKEAYNLYDNMLWILLMREFKQKLESESDADSMEAGDVFLLCSKDGVMSKMREDLYKEVDA